MKTIKKNVYYCEYCNKHGLSASKMVIHERHCTANPERDCRLCGYNGGFIEKITELKKRFTIVKEQEKYTGFDIDIIKWEDKEITIDELKNITDGCPNCILTIIRGIGLIHYGFDFHFDYKTELAEYWKMINEEDLRNEEYANY